MTRGNKKWAFLMVQWLRLHAASTWVRVQSLVRELRSSRMPCNTAKRLNKEICLLRLFSEKKKKKGEKDGKNGKILVVTKRTETSTGTLFKCFCIILGLKDHTKFQIL